ncbi:hypothetical protein [Marivita sp.]|uniref:hypothetical protein n=1 Tax=Marivita sp. TaxID=2003365 RepID=UPI003B525D32
MPTATGRKTTRGRPPINIFNTRKPTLSKSKSFNESLPLQDMIIGFRHRLWRRRYPYPHGRMITDPSVKHVAWSTRFPSDENNRPYYHAERAMLLCGRRYPEKRYDKKGRPVAQPTLYETFFWFHAFCCDMMSESPRYAVSWTRRGQKPDPEKIYRTGVSTLIARRILMPCGGNPWFIPSPVEISQVWKVIFEEDEDAESIRKRLPSVAWFCANFKEEFRFKFTRERNSIYKLATPLERKYPGIAPKKVNRRKKK